MQFSDIYTIYSRLIDMSKIEKLKAIKTKREKESL